MKRREFAAALAAGCVGAPVLGLGTPPAAEAPRPQDRRKVLMKLGCQSRRGTSAETLEYFARHGVTHIDPGRPAALPDGR